MKTVDKNFAIGKYPSRMHMDKDGYFTFSCRVGDSVHDWRTTILPLVLKREKGTYKLYEYASSNVVASGSKMYCIHYVIQFYIDKLLYSL